MKKYPLDGIERVCQVPLDEVQLQALLRHERVMIQAGSTLVHVLLKPNVTWEQALYAVAISPKPMNEGIADRNRRGRRHAAPRNLR